MAAHPFGAVHHELGRSRSGQRLRRRRGRGRYAGGSVPAAPRGRLPGLLRAHAASAAALPDGRGCSSIAACSSAAWSISACWTRASTEAIRPAVMERRPAAPPPAIRRARCSARDQERWLFEQLAGGARALDRDRPAGADVRSRQRSGGRSERAVLDGQVGWLRRVTQRVYEQLKSSGAANPIVLSGDVHAHYGADLKMDFADEKSETVGVEFTNSSITSGGDGSDVVAGVGAAAAAQPAPAVPQQSPRLRRLHRDDGDDARGVQDRRSRERAGRLAIRRARWSSRPAARAARATSTPGRPDGLSP